MTVQVEDPPVLDHGFVSGRFVTALPDSVSDEGRLPDLHGIEGNVRFTPAAPIYLTSAGNTATVVVSPQLVPVDSNGYLVDPESAADQTEIPGVWLPAGRYEVEPLFPSARTLKKFTIAVTTDHTLAAPLDLAVAAPLVVPPGSVEVVRIADRVRAEDAAAEAEGYRDELSAIVLQAVADGFPLATDTSAGLMPEADKALLNTATDAATPDSLAQRDSNGNVSVSTPTHSTHVSTKGYVDGRTQQVTGTEDGVMPAADKVKLDNLLVVDQNAEGDWVFSRGHTSNETRSRVAVEREYDTTLGDIFNSTASIEISMREQQNTSQNPPGYSMGVIALFEDGANGEQYQGESARMALISNRILFNRRVEVDMGGGGRAVLKAGTEPEDQYAQVSLHNSTYPHLRVYGPDNITEGFFSDVVISQASLRVYSGKSTAQVWENTDASGKTVRTELMQFGPGHQTLRASRDGAEVGQIRFEPSDMSLRLGAGSGGIQLTAKTLASDDIELSATKHVITRSPNGTRYRLKVNDDGTLTTEAA